MSATATKNVSAFVSVKTAARVLGVSEATIRRRVDDSSLLGYKLGAIRRVAASELDRLAGADQS